MTPEEAAVIDRQIRDMMRFLCPTCVETLKKVAMFRAAVKK